jgi:hypothetical protein
LMGFATLYPSFCNGPRLVNPSLRYLLAGSRFCTGSARGRHLMGFEEDRPTNLRMRGRSADWMGSGLT